MAESIAKNSFPALFGKLEKMKNAALNAPLSMSDINTLLSMHFNNEPLYPSIDAFYSEEYLKAEENGVSIEELEKIERFRKPTKEEVNTLYCDIHVRDEKDQVSSTNQ